MAGYSYIAENKNDPGMLSCNEAESSNDSADRGNSVAKKELVLTQGGIAAGGDSATEGNRTTKDDIAIGIETKPVVVPVPSGAIL